VRIYVGATVAVLAIAAIGCGSGGDITEVELTKAQFIKRGDAICDAGKKKKEKAIASLNEEQQGKALADFTGKELEDLYSTIILPNIQSVANRLAELNPPDGRAARMVRSLGEAVDAVRKDPSLALNGAPYAQAERMANAYGFEACNLF
jgi:hypothetical protein